MNQNIWGSHLWFSLHTITFSYPINPNIKDMKQYKEFFHSLQHVIPCAVCKRNYKRHLIEHPIDNHLNSRKKLVFWLIDIHNMVNAEIGKKIYDYDVIIKKYENAYNKKIDLSDNSKISKNNQINFNIVYLSLVVIFTLLILYFIYFMYFSRNNFR